MIYILPTDTCFGLACPITEHGNYDKIYKIKKRDFGKPLAILVSSFEWLEKYTSLNQEQINFLKKYEKPFTILTESSSTKIWLNFVDEETGEEFRNRAVYEKIGFRVANNSVEKKLLKENGPMFLTSANISGKGEIYTVKEIKEEFGEYLKKGVLKFVGEELGDLKIPLTPFIKGECVKSEGSFLGVSEIFEFVGESLERKVVRG